jgi:hypothetical protein
MLRHRVTLFVALASLVIADEALGASGPPPFVTGQPTPVIVTNPSTSPASTTVTNPATAPALTSSVDDPGRIPYQARLSSNDCVSNGGCIITPPAVPSGKRLVIQHAALETFVALTTRTGATFVELFFALAPVGTEQLLSAFQVPILGPDVAAGLFRVAGDQAVQFYVDGGKSFVVQPVTNGTFQGAPIINLTGYLLDCTVSSCTAMAP